MALKPPVSISQARRSPKAAARRKSFCARMGGMRKKLTSAKTAGDPNSRINRALADWDCDIPELLPRQYVTKRIRVKNPEALMGLQRPHWDMNMGEEFDHPGMDSNDYGENPGKRSVRVVQRGRRRNPVKEPFRYVALIDEGGMQYGADSRTPQTWLFTLRRPGKFATDWQGNKVRVYNYFRLPVALVRVEEFQAWVASNWRYAHGTKAALEKHLKSYMAK